LELLERNKLAIVIHLFYVDIFVEKILPSLKKLPKDSYDLFITTPFSEDFVRGLCVGVDAIVCSYENKGRDILPFLKAVKQHIIHKYDLFLKIHTKRNFKDNRNQDFKNFWDNVWNDNYYEFLLDSTIITSTCVFLIKNKNIYLGGIPNSILSFNKHICDNFPRVFIYLKRLGLEYSHSMEFFSGTMFYGKTEVIEPLFFLIDENWDDDASQKKDGTMAHVVERLFLCHAKAYKSLERIQEST